MDEKDIKLRETWSNTFFLMIQMSGHMQVGEMIWLAVGDDIRRDDHAVFMIIDRKNKMVKSGDDLYKMIKQPDKRVYSGPMERYDRLMRFKMPEQDSDNIRR